MLPFKSEAVALVVLAFYFLFLDQETQESRLQQLLLLQHLKRSRRKRLDVRGRGRETNSSSKLDLLNGNFVEEWWKENFFVDRNQTWKPGRKPGLENVIE